MKNSVDIRDRENKNVTVRRGDLPNHPGTTVARSLAEVPDGYRVKLLRHKGKKKRKGFLPTLLVIGDPDCELFCGSG